MTTSQNHILDLWKQAKLARPTYSFLTPKDTQGKVGAWLTYSPTGEVEVFETLEGAKTLAPSGVLKLKNFTEIFAPALATQYTLVDDLGIELVVSQFQIIDNDSSWVGKDIAASLTGKTVWIKVNNYFKIPDDHPDAPSPFTFHQFTQKRIVVTRREIRDLEMPGFEPSLEHAKKLKWWKKAHATVFKGAGEYFVVIDTKRKSLKTILPGDQDLGEDPLDQQSEVIAVNQAAKNDGFSTLLKEFGKVIDEDKYDLFLKNYVILRDTWIANRPNSTYKTLIAIPVQYFEALAPVDPSQLNASYSLEITPQQLEQYKKQVSQYFKTVVRPHVEENNVSLNIPKEINCLTGLIEAIQELDKNTHESRSPEGNTINRIINIYFAGADSYSITYIFAKIPNNTDAVYYDLAKTKIGSNPNFTRTRTLLYLINLIKMATDVQNVSTSGMNWITFLTFYTFDCPEISSHSGMKSQLEISDSVIREAEKKLLPVMTAEKRKSALAEALSPHIKSVVSDAKANMYMKLQDPTIKKIILNGVGFDSTDQIYDQILSKMDIHQLIYLSKLATDPDRRSQWFENKFELKNLESKWKMAGNYKDKFINSLQMDPKKEVSAAKKLAVTLPDTHTIVDITAKAAQTAYWSLKNTIGDAIKEQINNLLKEIADFLGGVKQDNTSQDNFSELALPDMVTPDMLPAIENNLNSLPNIFANELDISLIFIIISQNATPKELVSIFEGNGDLEVIQILHNELTERILLLQPSLTDVYRTEDFLMALGKTLLPALKSTVAQKEIEKFSPEAYSAFCVDMSPQVVDYLTDRFPEHVSLAQINRNKIEKDNFLKFLNNFENALSGDLENFLFGEDISSALDFEHSDPSNDSMVEMALGAYFLPIAGIFEMESMNAGAFFLETQLVDQDPGMPPVAYAYTGQDEEDTNSTLPPGTSIVHDVKKGVRNLQNSLKNTNNFAWSRTFVHLGGATPYDDYLYVIPDGGSIKLSFYLMEQYSFGAKNEEVSLQPPYIYKNPIDNPNKENYFIRITYRDKHGNLIFTFVRELPASENAIKLINNDDSGISPQASAYGTFIKNIVDEAMVKYSSDFSWKDKPGFLPDGPKFHYSNFFPELKSFLFSFQSEKLIEFIALKISNGPFFHKTNLEKLRMDTPTHGTPQEFEDSDEPAESQIAGEETGKPNKNLDKFINLDNIIERVKKKRRFFEILERREKNKINGRSAMENAIIMESIELFFKTYVLETLLAGVAVYGDIDTKTLASYDGNYEINKNIIVKQIERLGNGFKYEFFNMMLEYASYRSNITREDAYFKPLPENLEIDNIDQIMSLILKEQFQASLPLFRKKAQMALGDTKLQPNEFLDFIPNISCAPSSVFGTFSDAPRRLLDPADEEKMFIAQSGGFVLERYLKVDTPTMINGGNEVVFSRLKEWTRDIPQNTITSYIANGDTGKGFLGSSYNPKIAPEPAMGSMYAFATWLGSNTQYLPDNILKDIGSTAATIYLLARLELDGVGWFAKNIPIYKQLSNIDKSAEITPTGDYAFYTYPNLTGVVTTSAFSDFQKKIIDYNNEVLSEAESVLANFKMSAKTIDITRANRKEAGNKWMENAVRLDMWYAAYKAAVKLITSQGSVVWDQKYRVVEGGKIIYTDVYVVATDRKLWKEWESLDVSLENILEPWNNAQILKTLAEAKNNDQKIMKEIAKETGMGIQYYLNMLSDEGLENFLKKLNVGGAIQDILDNPQANVKLSEINTAMENFHFGLEAGLDYYNKVIEETQAAIDNGDGLYWYGDDYTEVDNYGKNEKAKKLRDRLIVRKDMLDIGFPVDKVGDEPGENIPLKAIIKQYEDSLKALNEAEAALNAAEAGVTSLYNEMTTGQTWSYKVVDLEEFATGAVAEAEKKLSELRATAFVMPYNHYLTELKYGIRLVYYFPQQDDIEDPISDLPILGQERLNGIKDMWRSIMPPPWKAANYKEKIFNTKEVVVPTEGIFLNEGIITSVEEHSFYGIPLLTMEEDVEAYLNDAYLHIEDERIIGRFDDAVADLKKKLIETPEYKMLISEIMYYPELLNALGLYCTASITKDVLSFSDLGLYSGTKFNLKQIIQSILKEQGVTFMDPESKSLEKLKNSFSNLKNPTKDPSLTGEVFFDAIGAAAIMASKTGLKILKGYVETTDPAIIMGKKIQEGMIAGMSTTKKLGETVGSIVSAAQVVAGGGENNESEKTLKAADDAIKAASSEAALASIVFSPLVAPFPIYPLPASVITPAGITYLASATAAEAFEKAEKKAKDKMK